MSRIFVHLDMDAFFAAIEQLDHPEYRGKPVVVGADPQEGKGRGVVSTCSYEARKFGVHSAMPISQAYRRCPQAIYVRPRGRRYAQMSKKIMAILSTFSPDIEQISIDEAFLDITSTYKFYGSPEKTALAMKKKIFDETGLTCSVGVAPSKFVAKIASDLQKPDGLVVVKKSDVKEFLAPLNISRLWGVGPKTLPLLQKLGIQTIGDLARFSQNELVRLFGKSGLHFWYLANGIDRREIEHESRHKSISKETTFAQDVDDEDCLRQTLDYLCEELAREMRKKGYRGRTITFKIRLQDFSTFTRSRTLARATNSSTDLRQTAARVFSEFDRQGKKVRLLGIGVSNLEYHQGQMDLFDEQHEDRTEKIDEIMDRIKEKFGEKAITRASLLNVDHDSQWIRE